MRRYYALVDVNFHKNPLPPPSNFSKLSSTIFLTLSPSLPYLSGWRQLWTTPKMKWRWKSDRTVEIIYNERTDHCGTQYLTLSWSNKRYSIETYCILFVRYDLIQSLDVPLIPYLFAELRLSFVLIMLI